MDVLALAALSDALPDSAMLVRATTVAPVNLVAAAFRTDLNVTGSGYLHAIFGKNAGGFSVVVFRVTIDGGTPLIVDGDGASGVAGDVNVRGYIVGSRFKTSLLVEIQNSDTVTRTVGSTTIYSLDG